MEANLWQSVATALSLLLLLLTWRALRYLVWRPYRMSSLFRRQGIRGPPYRLLVGSLPQLKKMLATGRANGLDVVSHDCVATVIPFFRKWASDYGKTFLYWLGPTPALCSTDMDLVKQVLTDRTDLFQKDYMNPSLDAVLGNGVILANGDDWKRRRKFVHPAFNQEKIKSMSAMTWECTRQMMGLWCSKLQEEGKASAEIDMRQDAGEVAMSVIARVMLGSNYKEAWEVFIASEELLELAAYALADPPIPGFRYLPTRRNRRTSQLDKLVTRKISQIIEARLAAGGFLGDDLLGLMMQQACTGTGSKDDQLSTAEMIGECKTFFAAGHDTTANLIAWAMFLLARYPRWQEMVREEVGRECPAGDEMMSVDSLSKLKLLNMLLLETLRLYGPLGYLQRRTAADTVLADIKVPKGTMITIPLMLLHRDKHVWGADANEFNPMRFINGVSGASKEHSNALLAFSYGPRICAGQNFAMVQVQTVIATIINTFSFSLSPSYVHKPSSFLTLRPRYGLPLIITKLQQPTNGA